MKNEDGIEESAAEELLLDKRVIPVEQQFFQTCLLEALKDLNAVARINGKITDGIGKELIHLVSAVCKVHMRGVLHAEIDEALPRAFDLLKTVNQLEDARIKEILAETMQDAAKQIKLKMKIEVVK